MAEMALHSIGSVERDTGVGRDTLRVWERRYGFPQPVRNEKGERLYPENQLRRLQRIKRMLTQGLRPGKLLPLSDAELDEIEVSLSNEVVQKQNAVVAPAVDEVITAVKEADAQEVRSILERTYEQLGVEGFLQEFCMPLVKTVGDQWAAGKIKIFEEHFISQQLTHFLSIKIAECDIDRTKPKVLLATMPGEEHTIGLLMLSTLLTSKGITTIFLGSEVPLEQIRDAIDHFEADYVGITFSGAYQYSSIRTDLTDLRVALPDEVEIWIGGEGVARLRKLPKGVVKFNSFDNLPV